MRARSTSSHNPFSMPQGGLEALQGDPLKVYAYQYDLACNGYELISGGDPQPQAGNHVQGLRDRGLPAAEEVEKRFGGMVKAFQYGAPPHGGCAAGIDRIVMLLADDANIREVIMFPMNQRAEDLLMGAPSEPTNEQLRELCACASCRRNDPPLAPRNFPRGADSFTKQRRNIC